MHTMHTAKRDWHERFYLYRRTDVSGYSGTGVVAEGVRWEDGVCTVRWCVPGKPRTTVLYDSILDVADIHGHDGSTMVIWMDDLPNRRFAGEQQEAAGNENAIPASAEVA